MSTSAAAKAAEIHPNTLRWYEETGRLPPIPRTPAGYRMFTPQLVLHARIVSLCHRMAWIDGPIRRQSLSIIAACRNQSLTEGAALTRRLIGFLKREELLARDALEVLRRWHRGKHRETSLEHLLRHSEAARLLELGADQIRNWERNGLILIPRDPVNGYRIFGSEDIDRLRVIRLCRTAGYSLTAIVRLLQAVDACPPDTPLNLKAIANTPGEAEKGFFNTFPSDTLLTTLARTTRMAEEVLDLIGQLNG